MFPQRASKADLRRAAPDITLAALLVSALALLVAACSDPPLARAPLVNSGSYDWQDQLRGPDGYPLPGWGYVVNKAL